MELAELRLALASHGCALLRDTCTFLATPRNLAPRPRMSTMSSEVLAGLTAALPSQAETPRDRLFLLWTRGERPTLPVPPLAAHSGLLL